MGKTLKQILERGAVEASAPCRIDMGGTLDIQTFYLPLRHFSPCTVNAALNLRTRIRLMPHVSGRIKISSTGFRSADYVFDRIPFRHPLGLMFAVAAYFGQDGIHIRIDSASPPRSGLGGSSAAAVALIGAFSTAMVMTDRSPGHFVRLAHALEESVAGVPCGVQDQLAAAFGGVHRWYWRGDLKNRPYRRQRLLDRNACQRFERQLLVAYCGQPHESAQVNLKWVRQFLSGKYRPQWIDIIRCTHRFAEALHRGDVDQAVQWMNRETDIRRQMTPEVLDAVGKALVRAARQEGCGARFTGAGGGGCIWAIGGEDNTHRLRDRWQSVMSRYPSAYVLETRIDPEGIRVETGIK